MEEEVKSENLPIIKSETSSKMTDGEMKTEMTKEDDNGNLREDNEMTAAELAHYRHMALFIAWLSVILLFVLGVFSFVAANLCDSSAAFGFGFDCILDVFTSVVVIWRFMGSFGTLYSSERERMALLILGILFIGACVSIVSRSIPDLLEHKIPKDVTDKEERNPLQLVGRSNADKESFSSTKQTKSNPVTLSSEFNALTNLPIFSVLQNFRKLTEDLWVIIIASSACLVCAGLAASKFNVAKKLSSTSIRSDGYSSLAGAITCLSWVVTAASIKYNPRLWFLDDVVGICVAVLLFVYGVKLIYEVLREPQVISAIKSLCNNSSR